MIKAAVIRFPGSNCDQDCHLALQHLGAAAEYVWHKEDSLAGFDLVVLPGGFSYGDYLRAGAIARFSPIMRAVAAAAREGRMILGICNGFQILCEAHLLPGALRRNRDLHFICEHVRVRVETCASPWTAHAATGEILRLPIAHGEGNYIADVATLNKLNREGRVLLRYCDRQGGVGDAANPNGAAESIAGICSEQGNIFGLMPHPERACDLRLGSDSGRLILESVLSRLGMRAAA